MGICELGEPGEAATVVTSQVRIAEKSSGDSWMEIEIGSIVEELDDSERNLFSQEHCNKKHNNVNKIIREIYAIIALQIYFRYLEGVEELSKRTTDGHRSFKSSATLASS